LPARAACPIPVATAEAIPVCPDRRFGLSTRIDAPAGRKGTTAYLGGDRADDEAMELGRAQAVGERPHDDDAVDHDLVVVQLGRHLRTVA
jgi:hypothetical protein